MLGKKASRTFGAVQLRRPAAGRLPLRAPPSMSRKGECWDNPSMESFFHTLKAERIHHRNYASRAEARWDLLGYIEGFYNSRRLHAVLSFISPAEMERRAA